MTRLVALQHTTSAALLRGLDAVWAEGAAALPLDPGAPAAVVDHLLTTLAPAEVRTDTTARSTGSDLPVPDGTALVVATSGSTGTPRGIVLSHDALAASTAASRARLGAPDGVPWLGVLPLHHVAGVSTVLRSRAAGREPLLHERATPAVVDGAEAAWVSLVPTQLADLLDAGVALERHHGVLLGGAAAPPELLARARDAGVHVVTSYGATETCGGCVYDGVPLEGVEADVRDGLVRLRTRTLATGVRTAGGALEPVTDAEGWWTTGDRGEVVDGRLVVHGRADDLAVSGGENVPLGPVRAALEGLPGLAASAVVALPDERWGQAVAAVVVPSRTAPTLAEVRSALAPLLPRRHLPTVLVVVPAIPRSGLGKVTATSVLAAVERGVAVAHHHRDRAD